MPLIMTPEMSALLWVLTLTGLLWVPYILQLIFQLGFARAIWDPAGAHPHDADWALRAKRAHYNAVENLVVFAPLVLMIALTGCGTELTAAAAWLYVSVRAAHYVAHLFAVPIIRTVFFLAGFSCQTVLALTLFGLL